MHHPVMLMENKRPQIYILAGEASGDRLGADLMTALREMAFAGRIEGVGGEKMIAAGLKTQFPMSDLSVMGLTDVLLALPTLYRRGNQVVKAIMSKQPEIVVLIDSQEFSFRVAKKLRNLGFRGSIVLYVAPAVWVHSPHRAAKYASVFDEILAILPFEPKILAELNGPKCTYVGHPAIKKNQVRSDLKDSGIHVALYPGSRHGELRRHLPLFESVTERINKAVPGVTFFMPTLPHLEERLKTLTSDWPVKVLISSDASWRDQHLRKTSASLTVAGTATLELAASKVPMIVNYVMDRAQARKFKSLDDFQASLPNIVLNEKLVPEFIQSAGDAKPVSDALIELLRSKPLQNKQLEGFDRMVDAFLSNGSDNDAAEIESAAKCVMRYLKP